TAGLAVWRVAHGDISVSVGDSVIRSAPQSAASNVPIRRNALNAMNASVTYPSSWNHGTVHGASAEHALLLAKNSTRSTSQWYSERGAPTTTNGAAYHRTRRSRRSRPISRMTASGYMQMRWYQQRRHGTK